MPNENDGSYDYERHQPKVPEVKVGHWKICIYQQTAWFDALKSWHINKNKLWLGWKVSAQGTKREGRTMQNYNLRTECCIRTHIWCPMKIWWDASAQGTGNEGRTL
jgi:hypothetical protein